MSVRCGYLLLTHVVQSRQEVSLMPEKSHWPFSGDVWKRGARGSNRSAGFEGDVVLADQRALRRRMRHDRLIVGGRAHTKRAGLS